MTQLGSYVTHIISSIKNIYILWIQEKKGPQWILNIPELYFIVNSAKNLQDVMATRDLRPC